KNNAAGAMTAASATGGLRRSLANEWRPTDKHTRRKPGQMSRTCHDGITERLSLTVPQRDISPGQRNQQTIDRPADMSNVTAPVLRHLLLGTPEARCIRRCWPRYRERHRPSEDLDCPESPSVCWLPGQACKRPSRDALPHRPGI